MINSARLIEQFTQADGYLASQNPFSVFGNPDQMKSQTMLGMRSSPVFLHYTLKYATKTGLRPALSGGTTGGHSSPALKGWGFLPDLIKMDKTRRFGAGKKPRWADKPIEDFFP